MDSGWRVFALTGLTSRGGLSNWVFFLFPDRLVMIDVGLAPAIKAGAQAGIGGGPGADYGPQKGAFQPTEAWCEELRSKAKAVRELALDQLAEVRLHRRMLAHQLFVRGGDGTTMKFSLMSRDQADPAILVLHERLGERLVITASGPFAFLARHAPFLVK